MRTIVMIQLKDWIKHHEACKLHPYIDTVGKLTIGWGRNIQDNGISKAEADYLFENDFNRCQADLIKYKWYTDQPQNIQYALMDMCFNLGIGKLLGFKKMIAALQEKNYTQAAIEALDSKWATQVKTRAQDVALLIREGL